MNKNLPKILNVNIEDNDIKELFIELENSKLKFNHSRKNSGSGITQVFGYADRRVAGWGELSNNFKYPFLYNKIVNYANKYNIKFDAIQVNKNYKCKKHIDAKNDECSIIIGLGDYEGGELCIELDENTTNSYNIKNKFLQFNGSHFYHYVNDFINTRYTLVFFTSDKKYKKQTIKQRLFNINKDTLCKINGLEYKLKLHEKDNKNTTEIKNNINILKNNIKNIEYLDTTEYKNNTIYFDEDNNIYIKEENN